MDLEEANNDSEVLLELDIIYKPTKIPLHIIQYPLRNVDAPFDRFLALSEVKMKPIQRKLDFLYRTEKKFENLNRTNKTQDDIKIKYSSKYVNNRTNYWVGALDEKNNKIFVYPVDSFYQMRKNFEDFQSSNRVEIQKTKIEKVSLMKEDIKIKKREKPLEQKLKNYTFQKEIMDSEKTLDVDFFGKNSHQSNDFIRKMGTLPKNIRELKPQSKEEYLRTIIEK